MNLLSDNLCLNYSIHICAWMSYLNFCLSEQLFLSCSFVAGQVVRALTPIDHPGGVIY